MTHCYECGRYVAVPVVYGGRHYCDACWADVPQDYKFPDTGSVTPTGTCYVDPATGEFSGDKFARVKELRWKVDSCPGCGVVTDIDYDGSADYQTKQDLSERVMADEPHDTPAVSLADFVTPLNDEQAEAFKALSESIKSEQKLGAEVGRLGTQAEPKTLDDESKQSKPIPLEVQALWLARHIEHVHSPYPDVVSDDELRGLTLVRVITLGADEYGDAAFHLNHVGCVKEKKEELSDFCFYDLVDRYWWAKEE